MVTVEQMSQSVERIKRDLGLSTAELADALDVSSHTLDRWRAGDAVPEREARGRLAELEALHVHLHETFMPEAIPVWLRRQSRYLAGVAPIEMLQRGNFERIEAALEAIDSGFFV